MVTGVQTCALPISPEERSLEALQEAIAITPPDEGPDWVREIAELANAKTIGNEKP